jgi:hypothetical protein
MQYDDYPDFNDYIDETYGEVIIGDFCRPASIVLFEMDEIEYLNLYNQYLNNQKELLLEKITEVFPAPIAFFYERAVHGYDNNNQRLHFLRSTWESIIFFLYALVVSEVIDSSVNISQIRIFNNQPIKCNKNGILSDKLGCKLEIIEKILDFNSQNRNGLISVDFIPVSVVSALGDLTKDRNSFSHVAALSEEQAKDLFERLYPKTQDILFELRKLEFLSILRYKSSGESLTSIRFSRFKGASLRDKNYNKDVDQAFIIKNLANLRIEYLFCEFEEHDQIICLSPFACAIKHNGQYHIAWYKKLDSSTSQYSFEIVSDSPVEIDLASNTFDKPIQALGALL